MSMFDWMDEMAGQLPYRQEMRIAKKERLHEIVAKIRGFDIKMTELMHAYRELEIKRHALVEEELRIADDLERTPR